LADLTGSEIIGDAGRKSSDERHIIISPPHPSALIDL
jgi:hypothetical protein